MVGDGMHLVKGDGILKNNKEINLPGVNVQLNALLKKI